MYRLTEAFIDVQNFLDRGGDVLTIIFFVTFLLWLFILERLHFFWRIFPAYQQTAIKDWQDRPEKSSWYAKRIRDLEVSLLNQKLNRSMMMIKTLIALCPLLGLLGTVTGMIEVFEIMAMVGTGNTRAMASGISKATIPTMAGMVGALSGIYFNARLERLIKRKRRAIKESMA
ncbi:MAG: MotA/TolQ/ExbB proton channel family protein [Myxococcota bacterium]|nr:MotA/TolQ/ExbB proton channel family protein [Myxococcota bacterium]